MIKIKKDLRPQTREILLYMNEKFYAFSTVYIIALYDSEFLIKMAHIDKTFYINNQYVLFELITCLIDYKNLDFRIKHCL